MLIAFFIWTLGAIIFLLLGLTSLKSKRPVGFFNFTRTPEVVDIRAYNRAVAKLWLIFSVLLELIGLPLLFIEQNSPYFVFLMLAVFSLVLAMMVSYLSILSKYRRR